MMCWNVLCEACRGFVGVNTSWLIANGRSYVCGRRWSVPAPHTLPPDWLVSFCLGGEQKSRKLPSSLHHSEEQFHHNAYCDMPRSFAADWSGRLYDTTLHLTGASTFVSSRPHLPLQCIDAFFCLVTSLASYLLSSPTRLSGLWPGTARLLIENPLLSG